MLSEMLHHPDFVALIEKMKKQYTNEAMSRNADDATVKHARERFHLLDELIGEMASANINKE